MRNKICYFLIGVIGLMVMPLVANATRYDESYTVQINYFGGVNEDDFNVYVCGAVDDDTGECNDEDWEYVSPSGSHEISDLELNRYGDDNYVGYIKIEKNDILPDYASDDYTIIYRNATGDLDLANRPINTFLGGEGPIDDVSELIFEFNDDDGVVDNIHYIDIYPLLRSFGWNFPDQNGLNVDFDDDGFCDMNCDTDDDGIADENIVTDAGILNGSAQLLTDESNEDNVLIRIAEGDYQILPGTEVTVELLPNHGYQLTSLSLNGTELEAGGDDNVGEFSFTMPDSNLHFKSVFQSIGDLVAKNSTVVEKAEVIGSAGAVEYGNIRLSISDIADANVKKRIDDNTPNGYVAAYLDLKLDNVIFKGSEEDVWSDNLSELGDEYVTITLELGDIVLTEDTYVVYEHEGVFHTIPASEIIYNAEDNTITFNASNFSNYALVTLTEPKTHTLKSGENDEFVMSFADLVSDGYVLEVNQLLDLLKLTDAELIENEIELTHTQIENIINGIKEGVKSKGTLIGLYEIFVYLNYNMKTEGPFTFKVKLTEELKKYNTFYIVYINDEYETTSTVISGKVEGDYIVFTLPHLSTYALTASYVEPPKVEEKVEEPIKEENPKTDDDILLYIGLGMISIVGVLGTTTYIKKKIGEIE